MEWIDSSFALPTTETPVLLCVRTGEHVVFRIGELVSNRLDPAVRHWLIDGKVSREVVTHWAYITTPKEK